MRFFRLFILFTALVSNFAAIAEESKVEIVVSLPPLKFIAEDLVKDRAQVSMISQSGSPHHRILKPSDVKMIDQADLILWIGKELEPYLEKFTKRNPDKNFSLIEHTSESVHIHAGDGHAGDNHSDHHDHDHGHHADHSGLDPHLWLSPAAVKEYVAVLVKQLAAADPANRAFYETNAQALVSAADKSILDWQTRMSALKGRPYFVYHDAYQYLEQILDIEGVAVLTVNPGVKPSAKKLGKLARQLDGYNAACVFFEPEFQKVRLDRVTNADIEYQLLDPVGSNFESQGKQTVQYVQFLDTLVGQIEQCLLRLPESA